MNIDDHNPEKTPVFAIIREDLLDEPGAPLERKVAVPKIVWDQETAEAEVERLNTINADKNCRYFWVFSRLVQRAAPAEQVTSS